MSDKPKDCPYCGQKIPAFTKENPREKIQKIFDKWENLKKGTPSKEELEEMLWETLSVYQTNTKEYREWADIVFADPKMNYSKLTTEQRSMNSLFEGNENVLKIMVLQIALKMMEVKKSE